MALGFFTNEDAMTPETIERRRKVVEALMKDSTSSAPIKSWTQGAAKIVQAISGQVQDNRLNEADKSNQEYQRQKIAALLGVGGSDAAAPSLSPSPVALPGASAPTPQGGGMAANNVAPAKDIYEGLIQRGLSPTLAAGFAGNFHGESGFKPDALGDKGTAFGLGQWRADRLASLRSLAASQGKDPSDIGVQLDHVVAELNGPEKRAMQLASAAKTPEEAAMLIAQHYERPAAWALAQSGPKRANYARGVFDQFGQPSATPAQMASAGGNVPMPQRALPGSAMAYSAAGAPVRTDAQGRALNPDGTPTSPGVSTQSSTPPTIPTPFGGLNQSQAVPDWKGMPAPQVIAQAIQARQAAGMPQAGAPMPPAGIPAPVQPPQGAPPVQMAQAPQAAPQSGLTGRAAIAAAMLSDPRLDATTKSLAMGLVQQQLAGNKLQYQTDGEGNIIALDTTGRIPPQIVHKAGVKPIVTGEDQVLRNPITGEVIGPAVEGSKSPTVQRVKQPDGSEVAVQWDRASKAWVPLNAPQGGNAVASPKLTEAQSKDVGFYNRGSAVIERLEKQDKALTGVLGNLASKVPGGNFIKPEDYRQAEQTGRELLAVILRKDTGAAVTDGEMSLYSNMYLPQPGDDATTIQQKREGRRNALEGLKMGLGSADILFKQREALEKIRKPEAPSADAAPKRRKFNPATGAIE